MSRLPAYQAMLGRRGLERKKGLAAKWTLEMELLLHALQPACVVCGRDDRLTVDHVRPLSKGFGLEPGNAVILCKSCNSRKRTRSLEDLPIRMAMAILAAAGDFKILWDHRA